MQNATELSDLQILRNLARSSGLELESRDILDLSGGQAASSDDGEACNAYCEGAFLEKCATRVLDRIASGEVTLNGPRA